MGGGGSSRIFWDFAHSHKPATFRGEGGGGGMFGVFLVTGGQDQSNYLNSGNFLGHFRVTSRLPEINCRKKTFTKSLGGGHGPPGPPLATPLSGKY